ncbi:hypothetical protein [Flexivirga sp.]|uniref:hypothetical protein n=1 Tax=Flexivirga sp. TaxID=1962927 RepID=UPI003F7E53DE
MSDDRVGRCPQMAADPSVSIAFRASREAAKALMADAGALRWLLHVVETRLRTDGETGVATHLHLDIAEAIVDAHIEELLEPAITPERLAQLRTDPRALVVIAALHYVTMPHCPMFTDGAEDLEILRWATEVARCELPVG